MTRGGKRNGAGRPETNHPKKHLIRLTDIEKDFIDFSRVKQIDLNKLKKGLLLFFLMLFTCMPVSATTLKGSVEYTVDIARSIAFEDVKQNISMEDYKNQLKDILHYSNIDYIQNGTFRLNAGYSRRLLPFFNKKGKLLAYGICYDDNPNTIFYYARWGNLIKIEFIQNPNTYPHKTISYDAKGELYTTSLYVAPGESYNFDRNGKLLVHWVGNYAYNEYGKELKLVRRL